MKKIFFILIFILLTTGCWNYQELNDYAIVTGMAVDYKDNKYEVSLLIANGDKKDDEDGKAQVTVSSASGKTIYEAIKNISLATPKELYISHLSVIVLSEEIAEAGVNPVLDFLLREPQSHQNFYLVIAKNHEAKKSLSVLTPLADYPSQNITFNIKMTEKLQGRITNASFNNFVSKILQKGNNPVSNSLVLVGDEEKGISQEEQDKSIASAYTKLDTLGLFKNDKLVGWATMDESIGINMLLGDVEILYLTLPCKNDYVVVTSSSYKIKNKVSKDKITVNIKADGMINEVGCDINLEDPKTIEIYQKKAEEKMKEYTNKAIVKAKKLKTDIFGYGNMIYQKFPTYFKNLNDWNETFTKLKININVDFKLKNKGTLEQTIGAQEK